MKLSEAIRLGGMSTVQAKGIYYDATNDGTCALGGAMLAIGHGWQSTLDFDDKLLKLFPILSTVGLYMEITTRNDSGQTREQIADYVAQVEAQQEQLKSEPSAELAQVVP